MPSQNDSTPSKPDISISSPPEQHPPSSHRKTHSNEPLPPYIQDRGQDPEYIAALQSWAEQKKYVIPGEDGTYDMSAGSLMKGFARPPDGIDEREAEERAREKEEKKRRKSEVKGKEKEGWGRRLSGLFGRENGKGEGEGEGEE